jgi:fumarylpyruvate hydrolase
MDGQKSANLFALANEPIENLFENPTPSVAIRGMQQGFAVRRIYCIGRNYAEHAKEMGAPEARGQRPVIFMKPADAVVADGAAVRYPGQTNNLHFEGELVIALQSGGRDIAIDQANSHIFGYAVGNDLTRRDLQTEAKKAGLPWDIGKGFDQSAPISAIQPVSAIGHVAQGMLRLWVNDVLKQQADLADMMWSVPEIISELSKLFELAAGDLIFTGTPAGVAALLPGDQVRIAIDGVGELRHGVVAG